MLLGHIVCKKGLLVDPTNINMILSFPPPKSVKQLRETLGHIGYYRKFICVYAAITNPMESLLENDVVFVCSQECQGSFDTLKAKMSSTPIIVSPNWNKEFHIHVDASSISLGVVLEHLGKGDLDHPISFTS